MKLDYNIKPYFIKMLTPKAESAAKINSVDRISDKFIEFNGDFSFIDDCVGVDIDDISSIIFCDIDVLGKYLRFTEILGLKIKIYDDIDTKIFNNELDLSKATKDLKSIINEYILKNFTIDDVLDKMNEGIKLTEIDYQILRK